MDVHWRYTMKPARLGPIDARAAFPLLLVMLHFRDYTLLMAVAFITLLWIFEKRGLQFDAALRTIRAWLVNPNRPAIDQRRANRMVDLYWRDAELAKRYDRWATQPAKK